MTFNNSSNNKNSTINNTAIVSSKELCKTIIAGEKILSIEEPNLEEKSTSKNKLINNLIQRHEQEEELNSQDSEEIDNLDEPSLQRQTSHQRPLSPSPTTTSSHHSIIPKKEFYLLQISTYSLLMFATIWGVLGRLGLNYLGSFAKSQIFVLIWPQMIGCLIMGMLLERKGLIERIFPPLFVAIGTGFCGSMTTFSSWMLGMFVSFTNLNTPTHGRFSGFLSGVADLVVTIGLSTAALQLGVHLSSFLPSSPPYEPRPKSTRYSPFHHIYSTLLGPLLYLGSILLLILGPNSWRSKATFAIVLGPPGTLLRYNLSKKLNPILSNFPLGTLIANLLAVLLISLLSLFQHYKGINEISCEMLQGFEDGFCGSLSTVSTFVVELRGLKRGDSWKYFWCSVIGAQLLLTVILGGWIWSGDRGLCTILA